MRDRWSLRRNEGAHLRLLADPGRSKEEAIERARRAPFDRLSSNGRVAEIEVRQMFEITDFSDVSQSVADLDASFKARRTGQQE